jgi:hypothetical protein
LDSNVAVGESAAGGVTIAQANRKAIRATIGAVISHADAENDPAPVFEARRATRAGAFPIERERTNVRSCNGDTSRRVVERERAFQAAGVTTPKLVVNSDPIPLQSRATGDGIEQIVASVRSSQVVLFLGSNQRTRRPDVYGGGAAISGGQLDALLTAPVQGTP